MDHEKIAQTVQTEFGGVCRYLGESRWSRLHISRLAKPWNNYDGYYGWDEPEDMQDRDLHDLRLQIERRIGELQAMADRREDCPFHLYDVVIRRDECDAHQWGYIDRFIGPDHVLVCWPRRGMALQFREAIADLISYKEWQQNPFAGMHQYWFLDELNQKRLREVTHEEKEAVACIE